MGEPKNWEENLSQCHVVHHEQRNDCPGIERGSPNMEPEILYAVHKKITNSVIRDEVQAIYNAVPYFQNVIRFHGTPVNVISFTSLGGLSQHSQPLYSIMRAGLIQNFTHD